MRYDITNIPVAEVFEERDGCPLCRLRDQLEQRVVEYITGAAMMEPDIRIQTNKQGFCIDHYRQMLARRNRLSVALILESHLDEMEKEIFAGLPLVGKSPRRQEKAATRRMDDCWVCNQMRDTIDKMLATVCRTWEAQKDFQRLFEEQPCLCLPHFSALSQTAQKVISKKEQSYFLRAAAELTRKYLKELRSDVHHFTEMYDYRNAGANSDADWGNSKDAIERAVQYLTGRQP